MTKEEKYNKLLSCYNETDRQFLAELTKDWIANAANFDWFCYKCKIEMVSHEFLKRLPYKQKDKVFGTLFNDHINDDWADHPKSERRYVLDNIADGQLKRLIRCSGDTKRLFDIIINYCD